METLFIAALVYLGLGALTCASPRSLEPDHAEHSLAGQFVVFRASLPEVLAWPRTLWRDFAG